VKEETSAEWNVTASPCVHGAAGAVGMVGEQGDGKLCKYTVGQKKRGGLAVYICP